MSEDIEYVNEGIQSIQLAMQQTRFTMQEVADAFYTLAPVLDKVWQEIVGNEFLWQARIDGHVYRSTPILGRFRWYRALRVWQLRRQITS